MYSIKFHSGLCISMLKLIYIFNFIRWGYTLFDNDHPADLCFVYFLCQGLLLSLIHFSINNGNSDKALVKQPSMIAISCVLHWYRVVVIQQAKNVYAVRFEKQLSWNICVCFWFVNISHQSKRRSGPLRPRSTEQAISNSQNMPRRRSIYIANRASMIFPSAWQRLISHSQMIPAWRAPQPASCCRFETFVPA